jgi:hypothetical protein
LSEAKSKNLDFTDRAIVFGALSATKDLAIRTRLRQQIRRKVARINFCFYRTGKLQIWHSTRITTYFPSLALNETEEGILVSSAVRDITKRKRIQGILYDKKDRTPGRRSGQRPVSGW